MCWPDFFSQMETINKLLKKQAPKVSKKAVAAGADGEEEARPEATWIRWVNTKNGSKVAVSEEIYQGPAGVVFGGGKSLPPGKMVEEVAWIKMLLLLKWVWILWDLEFEACTCRK